MLVSWPTPEYSCRIGGEPEIANMSVEPRMTSPQAFSFGTHIIKYTFTLAGGVDVVCPVTIVVRGKVLELFVLFDQILLLRNLCPTV